jgi:hypothetical protein
VRLREESIYKKRRWNKKIDRSYKLKISRKEEK